MILYIAGTFPALSETFVYREVLALRRRGCAVRTATLHPAPPRPELTRLAEQTLVIYRRGWFLRGMASLFRHPRRGARVVMAAAADLLLSRQTRVLDRLKLPVQALAALALAEDMWGISHIHAHFAHAPATVAMYLALAWRVPFSFTGHANDLFQRRAALDRKADRAAFVVAISRWHAAWFRRTVPRTSAPIRLIRCGVPLPAACRTHGTTPLKLLTVGRLVAKKGIDVLLRALAIMPQQERAKLTLQIIGEGDERNALGRLAVELGVEKEVQWLGPLPNAEVAERLQTSDLFVLPCRPDHRGDRDGIPVVLMEAMAAGLPVISTRFAAIEELVDHEMNGLLCPAGDVAAVAQAIARLVSDDAGRARMGAAARWKVMTEFDLESNVDRMLGAILGAAPANDARERKDDAKRILPDYPVPGRSALCAADAR